MFAFNPKTGELKRTGLHFSFKHTAATVAHCQNLISGQRAIFIVANIGDTELCMKACHMGSISQHLLLSPCLSVPVQFPLASDYLTEKKGRQLEDQ